MVTSSLIAATVGQKWRQPRERLGLRFRDVETARLRFAEKYRNEEYVIRISRLADIEQKSVMPGLHKLYSLCAIYRMDLAPVLAWYGIDLGNLAADSHCADIPRTHLIGFEAGDRGEVVMLLAVDPGLDLNKSFLAAISSDGGNSRCC